LSRQRGAKAQRRNSSENTIIFEQSRSENPYRHQKNRPINLIPRTRNQEKLVLALQDESQHIVMAVGPAGTGKTMLAVTAAIKALKAGECERIILTRPAVGVDEETHGFLPGTLNDKMQPWLIPILDVFRDYYSTREVERLIDEQIVEIAPLAFMRGRTFRDAWIIADECQGTSVNQMKMLLTRLGDNSKMVITGDLKQLDKKFQSDNGLQDFIARLQSYRGDTIGLVEFGTRDVQRHPIIKDILNLYGES
jgi:phosphate starvation-inducible protein PhoH and related proteins